MKTRTLPLFRLGLAFLAGSALACQEVDQSAPGPAQTSPNARIAPAPLLSGKSLVRPSPSVAASAGASSVPTARPPATAYSMWATPQPENPAEQPAVGVLLQAEFSWPGRSRSLQFHGLSPEVVAETRGSLLRAVSIDLSTPDRMRLELLGDAFPFPRGTAFLARSDREGHLLLWPDETTFRVVPHSALRSLFRERRLDVTPTLVPTLEPGKKGSRFDLDTRTERASTPYGTVELEQASVAEAGAAGELLCRFLLEFLAASPEDACGEGRVPVRAHFQFTPSGELLFTVKDLKRPAEAVTSPVAVPPRGARLAHSGLPRRSVALLDPAERAALRSGSDVATAVLTLANPSPLATYVVLDDTPLAFLGPGVTERVEGFRGGDYALSALTWFGEPLMPGASFKIPGRYLTGTPPPEADAGTH